MFLWLARLMLVGLAVGSFALINDFRSGADQARRIDTEVLATRLVVTQLDGLSWQAVAEGAPDFTVTDRTHQLSSALARQISSLRRSAAGYAQVQHLSALAVSLRQQLSAGEQLIVSRRVADAAQANLVGVDPTANILVNALNDAHFHFQQEGQRATTSADQGSLIVVIVATLLAALLWWALRRSRRRAAEVETETIRKNEERFRALVHNASEVIAVVDPDTTVRYITPTVASLLGRSPDELTGRSLTEAVDEQDHARLREFVRQLSTSSRAGRPTEWRGTRPDGAEVALEALSSNMLENPNVRGVVLTFRDISERKALEAELRHRAFHDELTGLANRALFEDRVDQVLRRARRQSPNAAVLFIDIDDFKTVNDSLGHATGDRLLVEAARRIDETRRGGDTAARLGGDEFAVLAEDLSDPRDALALAERLSETLAHPVMIDGRPLAIGASIGIAAVTSAIATSDDLMRNADIAMYAAKTAGKGRSELFRGDMLDAARQRLDLREDLRAARERGQLSVAYQPLVSLPTRTIIGAEALLRWQHPQHGAVSPADFIPIAEETGQIVDIGAWVLTEACRDLARWAETAPEIYVSVNVSPIQLDDDGFARIVESAVADSGIHPSRLTLEITETAFVGDHDKIEQTLRNIRSMGVRIAVDDFGTGYSSLSHLRRLSIDSVKIDRSFVQSIHERTHDATLVRSIVELARSLGLAVVAEGIENERQCTMLDETDCEIGQGFLFARPAPASTFTELLRDRRPAEAVGSSGPAAA